MAVGAGVAALALVWLVLVKPVRADAQAEARTASERALDRARFFPAIGAPVAEVEEALEAEKGTLQGLKVALDRMLLRVPDHLQPAEGRDSLYFQQQLARLRTAAESSGIGFDDRGAPFGFSKPPREDEVTEYLARIEVASRFLDAAGTAGLASVIRAEQPASKAGPSGGGRRAHELPMKVVVAADERTLMLFLHAIARPDRFLALKGLAVEVEDASAGHFEATVEFAGVTIVKDEGPVGPAPGGEDEGTGVSGPRRPFRRYRP